MCTVECENMRLDWFMSSGPEASGPKWTWELNQVTSANLRPVLLSSPGGWVREGGVYGRTAMDYISGWICFGCTVALIGITRVVTCVRETNLRVELNAYCTYSRITFWWRLEWNKLIIRLRFHAPVYLPPVQPSQTLHNPRSLFRFQDSRSNEKHHLVYMCDVVMTP